MACSDPESPAFWRQGCLIAWAAFFIGILISVCGAMALNQHHVTYSQMTAPDPPTLCTTSTGAPCSPEMQAAAQGYINSQNPKPDDGGGANLVAFGGIITNIAIVGGIIVWFILVSKRNKLEDRQYQQYQQRSNRNPDEQPPRN